MFLSPFTYSLILFPVSEVALSHNNNEVCIYRINGTRFELVHTLKEHAQRVTGIDWAARSNQIATCSAVRYS